MKKIKTAGTDITLEEIKSQHNKVAEMIATFEARAKLEADFPIIVPFPNLNPGELWAGFIISPTGNKRHHVILLPGDNEANTWEAQMEWAKSIGGDLPDRCEQSLLFASMREHFKQSAYWSSEQHVSYSHYAWYRGFNDGFQTYYDKSNKLRARAVRRSPI
jgi:hypothetical protein